MLLYFILLTASQNIFGQSSDPDKQIVFDLSNKISSTQTIDLNKKGITFINLVPGKREQYSFSINMKEDPIPPFTLSTTSASECANADSTLNAAIIGVQNSQTEEDVDKNLKKLKAEMKKLSSANQACIDFCNALIDKTTYTQPFLFNLKNNQTITVTVTRKFQTKEKKDTSATWTQTFKTPEKSPWLTHFGFTYQPNIISKYNQFYSKADTSNANRFTITKLNGHQTRFWQNISPTIMFSYPIRQKDSANYWAFSAIAATNFSTFSAGAGFSRVIGVNVALGTGIMFTQKYVLNGQYKEGDIIKTNLTYDQLHEKKWGPEIYFTIAFRFDKNPFSGSSSSGSGSTSTGSSGTGSSSTSTSH